MSSDAQEKGAAQQQKQKQQQGGQKNEKKKLSKAERIAQRANDQKRPTLKHPDDGDFGDLVMNQSVYRVKQCQFVTTKKKKY